MAYKRLRSPCILIPYRPHLEQRFPQPYLLPRRDWLTEGQGPLQTFVVADAKRATAYLSAGGSLFASKSDYVPTCAYCGPSPAWELAEDPVPRLALFLVYQQALLVQVWPSALLARARMALLGFA